MKNAEWMVQNGYKFNDLRWNFMQEPGICSFYLNGKNVGKVSSLSVFEALKTWLDMEHVEPILDDAEKNYLSAVIKPFRNRVQYIKKIDCACEEYIQIQLNSDWTILPHFRTGTMYKGMKSDHGYTLEELGL